METNIQEIALAIQGGDQDAFRRFYDEYFARIYTFLLAILRNPEDAEDVTSVAFIYVWNNRKSLQNPDQLVAWLYQVAKHRAFDQLRKKKAAFALSLDEAVDVADLVAATPEESADSSFTVRYVQELLSSLNETDRALVYLRFVEDLDFRQMADRTGSNTVAVRVRMHRIIKKLNKMSSEDDKAPFWFNPEGFL